MKPISFSNLWRNWQAILFDIGKSDMSSQQVSPSNCFGTLGLKRHLPGVFSCLLRFDLCLIHIHIHFLHIYNAISYQLYHFEKMYFYETLSNLTVAFPLGGLCWVLGKPSKKEKSLTFVKPAGGKGGGQVGQGG